MALGPNSLQMVYKTRDWKHRFFLATTSMCMTNAYLAYSWREKAEERKLMSQQDWKETLAWQLIKHNDFRTGRHLRVVHGEGNGAPLPQNTVYGMTHTRLVKSETRSNPHCKVCKTNRSAYYCSTCNAVLCHPISGRDCHLKHQLTYVEAADWARAREFVGIYEDIVPLTQEETQ